MKESAETDIPVEEELDHLSEQEAGGEHEPEATPDFSKFEKKDFVNLLKSLLAENDFRKFDALIREVKFHFAALQEKERLEALNRFTEAGGLQDDFQFRRDDLDASFDATYRVLRDRRMDQVKNLEAQRTENLKIKNELLDELRKLVENNENKHSFEKFKEVQLRWKTTGPVPAAHSRTLWASYQVLVDRFYDNRNIYFELKELDRKKNAEAKIELCVRAEKLAELPRINEAVRELNELHEEYRHIGPVAREEKEVIWERFKKASDAVYARRDAHNAEVMTTLRKNLELREQIVAEVVKFAEFNSDRIKEWNQKTQELMELQKQWESAGAVPRAATRDINKRFWAAFKVFFQHKSQYFRKLDEERKGNLELKRQLVAEAEKLKDSDAYESAANALKDLQVKWKEIGPVPDKFREKIYEEFRAACDHFFNRKRTKIEGEEKEQVANLEKKEALCLQLEQMIAEKSGTMEKLKEIQQAFQSIGFVPRKSMNAIKGRFNMLVEQLISSLDQLSDGEKDKMRMEMEMASLKSDPDAAHKLQAREQNLRKQIRKSEEELALLKNNLEFFARSKSKNAEQLRADVNQQITASEGALDQMKKQLKMLRATAN